MKRLLLALGICLSATGTLAQNFPGTTLGITPTSPTITSGAFTTTSQTAAPVPEGGATVDTVVTINGGKSGEKLTVTVPSGKSLFLDSEADNLFLKADAFLNGNDSISLRKQGSAWFEVSRNVESFEGGAVSYDTVYDMARDIASSPLVAGTPKFGGIATIAGEEIPYSFVIKRGDQQISTFTESEWFTPDEDDNCAFVVVNGDLTIDGDRFLRPASRKLCMVVYVTGNTTLGAGVPLGADPFAPLLHRHRRPHLLLRRPLQ